MAPAYLKKESAAARPVTRKHSLQHDGRPVGRFVVRIGSLNIGDRNLANGREINGENNVWSELKDRKRSRIDANVWLK